jgi:DNA mismatch repair protein MSH5
MYGLFHHLASTPQGKASLRRRFLRPSTSLKVIEGRLDAIDVLVRPDNSLAVEGLVKSIKKIRNMRAIMLQLRKGITTSKHGGRGINKGIWGGLQQFAFHSIKIRDSLQEINGIGKLEVARDIIRNFDHTVLRSVGTQITCIIDFEQSFEQYHTVVKPGIDDELDEMKHQYNGMEDLLAKAARSVAQEIHCDISQLNAIYYPQIGFLIVVPVDSTTGRGVFEGGDPNDVWELMFVSETSAFYKSDKMKQLDDTFGDIQSLICGWSS